MQYEPNQEKKLERPSNAYLYVLVKRKTLHEEYNHNIQKNYIALSAQKLDVI